MPAKKKFVKKSAHTTSKPRPKPVPRIVENKESVDKKEEMVINETIAVEKSTYFPEPMPVHEISSHDQGNEQSESSTSETPSVETQSEEENKENIHESYFSIENVEDTKKPLLSKNVMSTAIITLLILVLVTFLAYLYKQGYRVEVKKYEAQEAQPTKTVVEQPTVTPSPTPSLKDVTIQILNGSGVPKQAAFVQEMLDAKGFQVSDTGNAEESNYTTTIIRSKKTVSKVVLEKLQAALSDTYTIESESASTGSAYDITIIVGRKKSP